MWQRHCLDLQAMFRWVVKCIRRRGPDLERAMDAALYSYPASVTLYDFMQAAIAVARLNFDREDSIRTMTVGASEAYHRLENALLVAELAEVEENEYTQRVRAQLAGKRGAGE
jgi:hypothetical protein